MSFDVLAQVQYSYLLDGSTLIPTCVYTSGKSRHFSQVHVADSDTRIHTFLDCSTQLVEQNVVPSPSFVYIIGESCEFSRVLPSNSSKVHSTWMFDPYSATRMILCSGQCPELHICILLNVHDVTEIMSTDIDIDLLVFDSPFSSSCVLPNVYVIAKPTSALSGSVSKVLSCSSPQGIRSRSVQQLLSNSFMRYIENVLMN